MPLSTSIAFCRRKLQPSLAAGLLGIACASLLWPGAVGGAERVPVRAPNVVLVITDDQGYGDLACHGNSQIKTPALDRLFAESVRLVDFHVDPTCAPTRSALLTGRYSSRTGVWHTIMGRSLLRKDEVTLANLFQSAGYRTGIFGKWHLGDNYPYRPQDRGFDEVLIHGGGGISQTPDFWGNDYFDDTYFHNGQPEKQTGYCTDVFFNAALRFIEANRNRPFFTYIATNAPHSPYNVAEKYSQPYRDMGIPSPRAEFYGMITNIDENVARLEQRLRELGLYENTLVIFMTDNGSAAGANDPGGFNAGMRGVKGSQYDGGHRVPCFWRWPAGGIGGGRDVDALTAHIDILPTLADLCNLAVPDGVRLDGMSLVPLLRGNADWPERTLFVHSQRIEHPEKWRKCAVMTERWRLVDGKELFDIIADPGQKNDLAAGHPDVVGALRDAYEAWWNDISERFGEYVSIELGADEANPVHLTGHDWHSELLPVNQVQVRQDMVANGFWAVDVVQAGRYEITLRRRPAVDPAPLNAVRGEVEIGETRAEAPVPDGADALTLTVELAAGPQKLMTRLYGNDGQTRGAYFVEVKRVD